jgi:ribosomal protein S18 acetylase RimI-like enzyme
MKEGILHYRTEVQPLDPQRISDITESTGFFRPDEVEVAVSLAVDHLQEGEESGYHFIFAERDSQVLGFACFGPVPCTVSSYDLYWIVVRPDHQGMGVGHSLLRLCEKEIRRMGGSRVYVETSSRGQYEPTRRFYLNSLYCQAAVLEDFYAPGDAKVIYLKVLLP